MRVTRACRLEWRVDLEGKGIDNWHLRIGYSRRRFLMP